MSQVGVGQQEQEVNEVACEVSMPSEKCQALPVSDSSIFSSEETVEREIDCPANCDLIDNQIIESEQNVITSKDEDTSRIDVEACNDAIATSETFQGTESLNNEPDQTEDKSMPGESLSELKTAVETDKSGDIEETSQEENYQTVEQLNIPCDSKMSESLSEPHPVLECRIEQEENINLRELGEKQEMVEEDKKRKDEDEKEDEEMLGKCEEEEKAANIVTAEHISETTTNQEANASLSCRFSVENKEHQDGNQKELEATEEVGKLEDGEAASTHTTSIPVKEVCTVPSQEVKQVGSALADPPLVEGETASLKPGEEVVNNCSLKTKEESVLNMSKEEEQMSCTGRFEEPIPKCVAPQKTKEPGDLSSSSLTEIQEVSEDQKEGSAIICQVEEQHTSINHTDQQSSDNQEEIAVELPVPVEEVISEAVESGSLSSAFTMSRTCREMDKSDERKDGVSEASEEPNTISTVEKIQVDVDQIQSAPPNKESEDAVENESKPLTISAKLEDTVADETPVANSEHQVEKGNIQVEEQEECQKLESTGDVEQGNEEDKVEEKPMANFNQEDVEIQELEKKTTITSIDGNLEKGEIQGEEPKEKQLIPKPKVTEASEVVVVDQQAKEDPTTSQKQPEKVMGSRRAEKEAAKKQVMGTKQEKVPEKEALEKQVLGKKGKPEVKTEGKKKAPGKKQRKGEQHTVEKPVEAKATASNVKEGMESGKGVAEEKKEATRKHEVTEQKKGKEEKNFKVRKQENAEKRKEEKVKPVTKEEEKVKQITKEEEKAKQVTKEEEKVKQVTKEEKAKQVTKEEVKEVTKEEVKGKEVTKEEEKTKQVTKEEEKVKQDTKEEEKVKQVIKEEEKVKDVTSGEQKVEDKRDKKVITSQGKDEDVVIEKDDDEVSGKGEEEKQQQQQRPQRNRDDSASADLELDLGSEQESQNYDASSLVS